jgi:hypothetical protein
MIMMNRFPLARLLALGSLLLTIQFAAADDTNSTSASAAPEGGFSGTVVDTTNTADYTYVQVDTGTKKLWAVTTAFNVKIGDAVTVGSGMNMTDYHSKSLNRTFDSVYFTGSITVSGGDSGTTPALPPGHPALGGDSNPVLPPGHPSLTAPAAPNLDLTGIKKADGGNTIAEIYAAKSQLVGKTVIVRGKVVKYNAMILGKNWLHIQDGSGSADAHNNDLTVTSTDPAAVGATVLVTGTVSTDRDFGAGYKYGVMIEGAKVSVE